MTPDEINRAIAESVGVQFYPEDAEWRGPGGNVLDESPNYHGDLNAIQGAVDALQIGADRNAFIRRLQIVTEAMQKGKEHPDHDWLWWYVNATAPQRCEAYLRIIGKWRSE